VPLASAALHEVDLQVHDRRWRLSFFPAKDFLSPSERRLPMLAAMAGALLSVLLAALVVLLGRQRALALAQAQVSDDARRQSESVSAPFSGRRPWEWRKSTRRPGVLCASIKNMPTSSATRWRRCARPIFKASATPKTWWWTWPAWSA
jgi:hypothetical protein